MKFDLKFIAAIVPIVILNVVMIIWCLSDWRKRKEFRYLERYVWLIIILFIQIIGPLVYLLVARKDENN